MNFLIDEMIPRKVLKALTALGHNAVRVPASSSDMNNALLAHREKRILITLDNDFANTSLFFPTQFDIILIDIHPPYEHKLIEALTKLLNTMPPDKLKGLIILSENDSIRISE